jgi:hypothetical protein
MDITRREVQQERFVFMLFDEIDSLGRNGVGHGFIGPARCLAATHVSDPTDAVDNRLVMPVTWVHLE